MQSKSMKPKPVWVGYSMLSLVQNTLDGWMNGWLGGHGRGRGPQQERECKTIKQLKNT